MRRTALYLLIATGVAGCFAPTRGADPGLAALHLAGSAVADSRPAPETPVPTNYDYDDRPRDRTYATADLGAAPPGSVDAKTLLVARHAISAAEVRDCRKVAGSLRRR